MQSEGLGQRAVWSKGHLELAKPLSVVWRLQVTASGPMCMIVPHISALNDPHICFRVATCTRSTLVNEATVLAIGSCCRKPSHRDQICLGLPKKRHYLPFHLHDPKTTLQRLINGQSTRAVQSLVRFQSVETLKAGTRQAVEIDVGLLLFLSVRLRGCRFKYGWCLACFESLQRPCPVVSDVGASGSASLCTVCYWKDFLASLRLTFGALKAASPFAQPGVIS
jgi:hypothetical protein